jgi:hypothetical protein
MLEVPIADKLSLSAHMGDGLLCSCREAGNRASSPVHKIIALS